MIVTKEFLGDLEACKEGYRFLLENDYMNKDYDDTINFLRNAQQEDYATWLEEQKNTEKYVRMNGSVFTMGAYQIYNPFTGQHQKYETEEEAKQAAVELALQVLEQYGPFTNRELINENGDAAWIPTKLNLNISVEIQELNTENIL